MEISAHVKNGFRILDTNNDKKLSDKEAKFVRRLDGIDGSTKDGVVSIDELSVAFDQARLAVDAYESCPDSRKPSVKPALVTAMEKATAATSFAVNAKDIARLAQEARDRDVRINTHFEPTRGAKAAMVGGAGVAVGTAVAALFVASAAPLAAVGLVAIALIGAIVAIGAWAISYNTDEAALDPTLQNKAEVAQARAKQAEQEARAAWNTFGGIPQPLDSELCREPR